MNVNYKDKESISNICVFQPLCTAHKNYRLNILEKLLSFKYLFNINLDDHINNLINELNTDEDKNLFNFLIIQLNSTSLHES